MRFGTSARKLERDGDAAFFVDTIADAGLSGRAIMRSTRLALALVALVSGVGHAATQTVRGGTFTVKDPSAGVDATKRRIMAVAKEKASDDTLVGNPVATGGTLAVFANGATSTSQTFALPATGWSAFGSGFRYRDTHGANGPVASAQVGRTAGGTFFVKATILGKNGTVTVVPPNPGTDGGIILTITVGDSYCVGFGGAAGGTITASGNTAKVFKVKRPTGEQCPGAPTTTTTTAAATTTTSTTTTSTTTTSTTTTSTSTTTAPSTTTTTETTTTTTTTSTTATSTSTSTSTTETTTSTTTSTTTTTSSTSTSSTTTSTSTTTQLPTTTSSSTSTTTSTSTSTSTSTTTTTTTSTSTSTSTSSSTSTSTSTTSTTSSSTTTTLCAGHTFTVSMTSSAGGLFNDAQWPGGQVIQCVNPSCCVTLNRPSGDIVLVGTLGDAWTIVAFSGYSNCAFTSGCNTPNGGTCNGCSGVDAPSACPPAGIPNCTSNRPSCSTGLNGSATDSAHVQCAP